MKCESSAPGKLVLTGEYAVLKGAPAIVLGMNRRAKSIVESVASTTCSFKSTGFEASSQHNLLQFLANDPPEPHDPARQVWYVLQQLKNDNCLAKELTGFRVHTDSGALFSNGKKLGLGSSAAICTALTAGFLVLFGKSEQPKTKIIFDVAATAHSAGQDGLGSGLDIAAASYGGVIRYTRSDSQTGIATIKLPSNMHYQTFNSGQPADTRHYLGKFSTWMESAHTETFEVLCTTAARVAQVLGDKPLDWRVAMSDYIQSLQDFDAASKQGIYTQAHRSMHMLALEHRILYKPCGAGGGDLGIALSDDPEALKAFALAVKRATDTTAFLEIELEIDTNGVHTDSSQTG